MMKLPCLISAVWLPATSTDKGSQATISKLGSTPEITKPWISGAGVGAKVALPLFSLLAFLTLVGAGVDGALVDLPFFVTCAALLVSSLAAPAPSKMSPNCVSGTSRAFV